MIRWKKLEPGRITELLDEPGPRFQIVYRQGKWRLELGRWIPEHPTYISTKSLGGFATAAEAKKAAEEMRSQNEKLRNWG